MSAIRPTKTFFFFRCSIHQEPVIVKPLKKKSFLTTAQLRQKVMIAVMVAAVVKHVQVEVWEYIQSF